jgi:hypothetical protein
MPSVSTTTACALRLDRRGVRALEKEIGARSVDAEVGDGDAVTGRERHGLADRSASRRGRRVRL